MSIHIQTPFKPNKMRNSSLDDFNELESMNKELLEAFDAIDATASSYPTAIPQCFAPVTPNFDAELSGKFQN
jgi:hypothetical protein